MGELGDRLRTAREAQNLEVDQVAEATRIPRNYIEALENESFEAFTCELHGRGFLRNYASFLKLDADEILDQYDRLRGNTRSRKSTPVIPTPAPDNVRRSTWGIDALLGLVLVALVALAAMSVYQHQYQVEPTTTPAVASTPTVTPMPVFDGTTYDMDVNLNYAEHRLDVRQRIDYSNVTSDTLDNLMLNVHPNHGRGIFNLNDIKVDVDGELVEPDTYPLDVTLRVGLPRPLKPTEHVAVFLDYTLNVPKMSADAEFVKASFGYSKRGMSLGNWYPVMAPYRPDKGWYGQTYFEIGDPYVTDIADYSVTITATEGVVIAAAGQETHQGKTWHYEAKQVRTFAFVASDVYLSSSAQVGGSGGPTVHSYYFPANEEAGKVALDTAVQAMALYTEIYGPYPYADYRVVETESAAGLEFSGLTYIGSLFYDQYDGTTRTPLIPLVAHEAAHQWFYGLVGNDQVTQPWLDEAPAEYSAFLYYERYLPQDIDWWWFYAVDQWAPTGKIDSIIFLFRNNREYYDAVYRRGAQFMRDLRTTMGDPAFFGLMQEYQRRYMYRTATSRDFFTLVQEFTTADLVPLQEEYFRQRILP
jgi:transcriptional regulator with XRE-family HTH domain